MPSYFQSSRIGQTDRPLASLPVYDSRYNLHLHPWRILRFAQRSKKERELLEGFPSDVPAVVVLARNTLSFNFCSLVRNSNRQPNDGGRRNLNVTSVAKGLSSPFLRSLYSLTLEIEDRPPTAEPQRRPRYGLSSAPLLVQSPQSPSRRKDIAAPSRHGHNALSSRLRNNGLYTHDCNIPHPVFTAHTTLSTAGASQQYPFGLRHSSVEGPREAAIPIRYYQGVLTLVLGGERALTEGEQKQGCMVRGVQNPKGNGDQYDQCRFTLQQDILSGAEEVQTGEMVRFGSKRAGEVVGELFEGREELFGSSVSRFQWSRGLE